MLPLLAEDEPGAVRLATETLERFPDLFRAAWAERFAAKLGFAQGGGEATSLAERLLALMEEQGLDFTLVFRHLREAVAEEGEGTFLGLFPRAETAREWLDAWRGGLLTAGVPSDEAVSTMRRANPVFIPRNHRLEELIVAAKEKDFAPFHRLHAVLRRPYEEQPEAEEYERPPLPYEEVRATFCGT